MAGVCVVVMVSSMLVLFQNHPVARVLSGSLGFGRAAAGVNPLDRLSHGLVFPRPGARAALAFLPVVEAGGRNVQIKTALEQPVWVKVAQSDGRQASPLPAYLQAGARRPAATRAGGSKLVAAAPLPAARQLGWR